jgi:hypothetical protein
MGADRRVASDLVAGLQLSLETASSKGFEGEMTSDSNGFMLSPARLPQRKSVPWLRYRTKTEVFNTTITLHLPSAATMTSG